MASAFPSADQCASSLGWLAHIPGVNHANRQQGIRISKHARVPPTKQTLDTEKKKKKKKGEEEEEKKKKQKKGEEEEEKKKKKNKKKNAPNFGS